MYEAAVFSGEYREQPAQSLLQVHDLTVGYRSRDGGRVMALEGMSFEVNAGEAVGLLGESGCGKTTLGLSLLGLLPSSGAVDRGTAFFQGKNLLDLGDRELQQVRGIGISMVHQEPWAALNPVLGIGDQMTEVIHAHERFSRERAREKAGDLLASVGFPRESCIATAYPHQLSGGQRQRAAIAQAIACCPRLLIADEPTTALDQTTQADILDLLANLRKKMRLALLLISHDFSVLARAVDHIMVLRAGRIIQRGTTQEVADNSLGDYTQSLLGRATGAARRNHLRPVLVPKPGESAADSDDCGGFYFRKPQDRDRPREATGTAAGRQPSSLDPRLPPGAVEPATILFASNLEKRYRQGRWPSLNRHQVQALYGVELKICACSTVAIVGPSGSGKSTLARCLACLERPDDGEIWFGGVDLAALTDRRLVPFRRQIQLIFQDPGSSLNPRLTAAELVAEPLLIHRNKTKQESRDRALDLMWQVGLRPEWGERLPHEFSAGQRRRLAIARALGVEPKLLILDEALVGLDQPIQSQIADLLLQLQVTHSLTYLYISHDLDLITRIADRVIVLNQGQVVNTVDARELLGETGNLQASGLMSSTYEWAGLGRALA